MIDIVRFFGAGVMPVSVLVSHAGLSPHFLKLFETRSISRQTEGAKALTKFPAEGQTFSKLLIPTILFSPTFATARGFELFLGITGATLLRFEGFCVNIPYGADLPYSIGTTEPANMLSDENRWTKHEDREEHEVGKRNFSRARQLDSFFALFVLINSDLDRRIWQPALHSHNLHRAFRSGSQKYLSVALGQDAVVQDHDNSRVTFLPD
jgi:hypothetical protein